MRIVLADLSGKPGLVSKDTVGGGYGSRLIPFSVTTKLYYYFKKPFHDIPSISLAYLAAILAERGHEVVFTNNGIPDGDVAIILSSLVDHKNECSWADRARKKGLYTGFIGLASTFLPQLFAEHANFLIQGEAESAVQRLAEGERLEGACSSPPIEDLDTLPFPRWDLVNSWHRQKYRLPFHHRILGRGLPIMASRSCPEKCEYCPHRLMGSYRCRSAGNVVDEINWLFRFQERPFVVFRDPHFTAHRERVVEICELILKRRLRIQFEIETRLDRLDSELLVLLHRAGLRTVIFGVESASQDILNNAGRQSIHPDHQHRIISKCHEKGISTVAHFLLGFPEDDWHSIGATIQHALDLSPTIAQFKILTPYPGTLFWKRCESLITETSWEKFDGYQPTIKLAGLNSKELRFLLGAAYAHFYIRPSYLASYLPIKNGWIKRTLTRLDSRANYYLERQEKAIMGRTVLP